MKIVGIYIYMHTHVKKSRNKNAFPPRPNPDVWSFGLFWELSWEIIFNKPQGYMYIKLIFQSNRAYNLCLGINYEREF